MKETYLLGYYFKHEEDYDTEQGIYYLQYELSEDEAKVFLEMAKIYPEKGAEFEDHERRQFTLIYNPGDNTFTLIRRLE